MQRKHLAAAAQTDDTSTSVPATEEAPATEAPAVEEAPAAPTDQPEGCDEGGGTAADSSLESAVSA